MVHSGLQFSQAFNKPFSRISQALTILIWSFLAVLTDIEPMRLDIRFHTSNRLSLFISASRPPSLSTRLSLATHKLPPSSSGCSSPFPLISSPCGLIFGFAPQTASPCAYRPLGPPSILTHLPLAIHKPAPPASGRSVPFSPISSPCGSIFGFAPQTASPCAYRPPDRPAFQPASLSQYTSFHHPHLVVPGRSHRYRAHAARYSVSYLKPPLIVHIGLSAPQHFNSPLSCNPQVLPALISWFLAVLTAIEPMRLDNRFRTSDRPPRAYRPSGPPDFQYTFSLHLTGFP